MAIKLCGKYSPPQGTQSSSEIIFHFKDDQGTSSINVDVVIYPDFTRRSQGCQALGRHSAQLCESWCQCAPSGWLLRYSRFWRMLSYSITSTRQLMVYLLWTSTCSPSHYPLSYLHYLPVDLWKIALSLSWSIYAPLKQTFSSAVVVAPASIPMSILPGLQRTQILHGANMEPCIRCLYGTYSLFRTSTVGPWWKMQVEDLTKPL